MSTNATGAKPKYGKCNYCAKEFSDKNGFERHINLYKRVITKSQCNGCQKVFPRPDNVRQHQRVEANPCFEEQGFAPYQEENNPKFLAEPMHYLAEIVHVLAPMPPQLSVAEQLGVVIQMENQLLQGQLLPVPPHQFIQNQGNVLEDSPPSPASSVPSDDLGHVLIENGIPFTKTPKDSQGRRSYTVSESITLPEQDISLSGSFRSTELTTEATTASKMYVDLENQYTNLTRLPSRLDGKFDASNLTVEGSVTLGSLEAREVNVGKHDTVDLTVDRISDPQVREKRKERRMTND